MENWPHFEEKSAVNFQKDFEIVNWARIWGRYEQEKKQ